MCWPALLLLLVVVISWPPCANAGVPWCNPLQEKQLDAVQASYRREYSTLVLIHGTLMDQILTPVQVARLLVHSFPYFPNGLAISLALARRERWTPAPAVEHGATVAAAAAALGGGGAPGGLPALELMGSA
jgi:hypothetical protein